MRHDRRMLTVRCQLLAKRSMPKPSRLALSICESLLLAIGDLKIMGESEAVGVITGAAEAHREATSEVRTKPCTARSSAILDRILASGNSIRSP